MHKPQTLQFCNHEPLHFTLEMPRRPTNRRRPFRSQPLTFSPFARSSCLRMNQMNKSKLHLKSHSKPQGNGFIRNTSNPRKQSSNSSDDEEFEEIQADFAFFDPKPEDFHGMKTLLQNYLDDTLWDLSGFSDLILRQTTVGTVVKLEGDEDNGVFSFVTALNLGRYKDNRCIQELKEYLLKVCQEKDVKDDLRLLLEEQAYSVALLVSQRIVNLPPQLLPPLYDGLFDEISWAIEDEPTKELQDSFRFKMYIIVSKIYKLKSTDRKKRPTSETDNEILYVKAEDEIFHKLCSWFFCFPLLIQPQSTDELKGYQMMGLIMAVEASKVPSFRDELKSLINEC